MTTEAPLAPDALGPTVCVGEILVEIVATTVGEGFLEPLDLVGPFPSGAPAIFIDQCARAGGSAAMIGAVGNDDFGRLNVIRLDRDGVDVSAIAVDPDLPTGSAFVRYRPDGARDFVFNMWTSAAARIGWTEAVAALVGRSGHLHVMGTVLARPSAWEIIERAAAIIKGRGGSVSLDPNLRKEIKVDDETERRFAAMVGMSDLLLPSGEELERAAGVAGEDVALRKLFGLGIREVVLKRGARGATSSAATARGSMHRPSWSRRSTRLEPAIASAVPTWLADGSAWSLPPPSPTLARPGRGTSPGADRWKAPARGRSSIRFIAETERSA